MEKFTGVVKWFSAEKGFGFIAIDGGGDAFVHWRDIIGDGYRSLDANQTVTFGIEQEDRGPRAINVWATDEEAL